MRIWKTDEITNLFTQLDDAKASLLQNKDNEFMRPYLLDYVNYLEYLMNDIYVGRIENDE